MNFQCQEQGATPDLQRVLCRAHHGTIPLPKGQNFGLWVPDEGFQSAPPESRRHSGAGVAGAWVEVQVQALVEGGQDTAKRGTWAEFMWC